MRLRTIEIFEFFQCRFWFCVLMYSQQGSPRECPLIPSCGRSKPSRMENCRSQSEDSLWRPFTDYDGSHCQSAGQTYQCRVSADCFARRAPASGRLFRLPPQTKGRSVLAALAPHQAFLGSARVLQGLWRRVILGTWRFDYAPLQ
jgi:hypothetical protein